MPLGGPGLDSDADGDDDDVDLFCLEGELSEDELPDESDCPKKQPKDLSSLSPKALKTLVVVESPPATPPARKRVQELEAMIAEIEAPEAPSCPSLVILDESPAKEAAGAGPSEGSEALPQALPGMGEASLDRDEALPDALPDIGEASLDRDEPMPKGHG